MIEHNLKTYATLWDAVDNGSKPFEIRQDDRNFRVGDILVLWRTPDPLDSSDPAFHKSKVFTSISIRREVTFILRGGQFGISEGYVAMGLKP